MPAKGAKVNCSVFGCLNTSMKMRDLSFFRLPKDKERVKVWAVWIGREDILEKPKPDNYRVCAVHFEPQMFTNKRLNAEAVPTLYLPGIPGSSDSQPSSFDQSQPSTSKKERPDGEFQFRLIVINVYKYFCKQAGIPFDKQSHDSETVREQVIQATGVTKEALDDVLSDSDRVLSKIADHVPRKRKIKEVKESKKVKKQKLKMIKKDVGTFESQNVDKQNEAATSVTENTADESEIMYPRIKTEPDWEDPLNCEISIKQEIEFEVNEEGPADLEIEFDESVVKCEPESVPEVLVNVEVVKN